MMNKIKALKEAVLHLLIQLGPKQIADDDISEEELNLNTKLSQYLFLFTVLRRLSVTTQSEFLLQDKGGPCKITLGSK